MSYCLFYLLHKTMKKIWGSMMIILLALGSVAGSAYALFSDTVSIQGVSITSGSVDLLINGGDGTLNVAQKMNDNAQGIYPGYSSPGGIFDKFKLKNNSDTAMNMNLKAKIISYNGDWLAMKDKVEFEFVNVTTQESSQMHPLSEWNNGFVNLNAALQPGEEEEFVVALHVDPSAGEEIESKSLTNISFDIVGEQEF